MRRCSKSAGFHGSGLPASIHFFANSIPSRRAARDVLNSRAGNLRFDSFMSQVLIQQYLNQLQDLPERTASLVVREAFKDLLKGYARAWFIDLLVQIPFMMDSVV